MWEWMRDLMGNLVEVLSGSVVLSYIANTCVSVSVIILFLLLVRPFMKKLPRVYMYVLWGMVLLRMLCPVTIHGIYGMLPESVEQMAARTGQGWKAEYAVRDTVYKDMESYGGVANGFRLSEKVKQELEGISEERSSAVSKENGMRGDSAAPLTGEVKESEQARKAGTLETAVAGKSGNGLETENGRETAVQSGTVPEGRAESRSNGETAMRKGGNGMDAAAWLLVAWGMGVCLCLGYEFVSMFRTKWRFRDAKRMFGNVYTHPLVYGSFVAGVIFPKIYVPEQLDGREWAYVIRHEQVHIRRRDYLVKPVAFSIFSLLWFNPLVWAAYHFMMRDMEVSCDESVIRNLPAGERKKYSYLLLSMAGGLDMPSQSPAFSAGEVKERILNVSKYKKPRTFVSVLAVVSVVLCSCGIVSTPEETVQPVQPVPETETKPMYMEQDMELRDRVEIKKRINNRKYYRDYDIEFVMNPKNEFVWFQTLYTDFDKKENKRDILIMECFGANGEYRTPAWLKEYKKRFPDGRFWLERYKYGADGCLYLYVAEYSCDRVMYRYRYYENHKIPFERVKNHLLKVNEETGEVTEIPLPEQVSRDAEDYKIPERFIAGVARLEFCVYSDGTLLLMQEGENRGELYDGVTGSKLADISLENRASDVYSGDGFWVYASRNQVSKKLEVNVMDEDMGLLYSIPTEVEYDESRHLHMALGTKENTILMVCGEGVYEAELDEKEFRYIAGHKTDNFYHLWPDWYGLKVNSIYKGNEEDYYVAMTDYDEINDDGWPPGLLPDVWEDDLLFHYTQIDEG